MAHVYATFKSVNAEGKPLERAIRYATKNGGLPVFAKESERGRTIVVTSYSTFFFRDVKAVPLKQRCNHEYILGPCNLFIDIDAERFGNAHLYSDDTASNIIVDAILSELQKQFGIESQRVDVVCLDGSTKTKLSRHYTFNIRDSNGSYSVAWKNSTECGLFIDGVIARLNPHTHPGIYTRSKKCAYKCIIDKQVYGTRRSLRTYMSTKPKQPEKLLRTPEERQSGSTAPQLLTFLQSLVCHFLGNDQKEMTRLLTVSCSTEDAQNSTAFDDLVQCGGSFRPRRRFDSYSNDSSDIPEDLLQLVRHTLKCDLYNTSYNTSSNRLFTRVYSKECEIAKRKHSGNNVYYIFLFNSGVYYQGCPSEHCAGKHGPIRDIPGYNKRRKRRKVAVSTTDIDLQPLFPARAQL